MERQPEQPLLEAAASVADAQELGRQGLPVHQDPDAAGLLDEEQTAAAIARVRHEHRL